MGDYRKKVKLGSRHHNKDSQEYQRRPIG